MTTRTTRLLTVATALMIACVTIAGWAAVKTADWARDLPNRVVIESDGVGTALAHIVNESYHVALRDGDDATKLQILDEQFAPLVAENRDASTWIRNEYLKDITVLVDSDDPHVSAAASDLIAVLDAGDTLPPPDEGG